MKKAFVFILIMGISILASACNKGNNSDPIGTKSGDKAITAFSFSSPAATGIINESAKTISVIVPNGTPVNALIAIFTITGVSVKVDGVEQQSGSTKNDFTDAVIYTVFAEDGSTADYRVSVTAAAPAAINLPRTGQSISYDANTVQWDDGALRKGAAWPEPRFTFASSGTGTMATDELTGLGWSQDAKTPGPAGCGPGVSKTWLSALSYIACLNSNSYLGRSDWRLPNKNELKSLIDYGQANAYLWLNTQGFVNVQNFSYWSSTKYAGNATDAWIVDMVADTLLTGNKANVDYVWPVCDGKTGTISLPATGQTTSYAAGDDGALEKGTAWPSPRFTLASSGTGTVINDGLTGLMWLQDGGTPGTESCIGGGKKWQDALSYVECLNKLSYLGHSDWRLPNIHELESLFHAGYDEVYCASSVTCASNAAWLVNTYDTGSPNDTPGFVNVKANYYWSSTTDAGNIYNAWRISMEDGTALSISKESLVSAYVWPVRGGL